MKEKENLVNQEKEAFLEKVNKLPFGKVFSKFFIESTDPKGQTLDSDKKEITGKIPGLPSFYRMVLSNRWVQASLVTDVKTGRINIEESPLQIRVFSFKDKPIMTYYLIEPDVFNKDYDVSLHMNKEIFSLLPQDDDRILLDMIPNFRQKISQSQKEIRQGK